MRRPLKYFVDGSGVKLQAPSTKLDKLQAVGYYRSKQKGKL